MKKILIGAFISLYTLSGGAQLITDGYYRIHNVGSKRFAYIKDDKGSVNINSTSADLGAIQLWRDFDRAVSDPSSVIYFKSMGDKNYRFHCQGTNSYDIVGYDLIVRENTRQPGTYKAYQQKGGNVSYLCDAERADRDKGAMGTNDNGTNYRDWYISPVQANSTYYFGVKPEFTIGTSKYTAFFAEFPFSFASTGMSAYYIKKVEKGLAILEELKEGKVPGAMPVIIKCTSDNPADNKLNIGAHNAQTPKGNQLGGVYFCNIHGREDHKGNHWNTTDYNPETMRILTVSAEGKLVFGKADIKYIPANKAYLKVPAGSPDEILIVTQEEFDEITSSLFDVKAENQIKDNTIYTTYGEIVGKGFECLNNLPAGIYVMNGKKYVVK